MFLFNRVSDKNRRDEVTARWTQMESKVRPIVDLLESDEVAEKLNQTRFEFR
jgi:hypothetical protein